MLRSSPEPWQPEQRRRAVADLCWKVIINDMDSAEFDVITDHFGKGEAQPNDGGSVSGNLT